MYGLGPNIYICMIRVSVCLLTTHLLVKAAIENINTIDERW